ncbi:MAG: CoA pyrophosphatase [Rhizobiaceae bacterium]
MDHLTPDIYSSSAFRERVLERFQSRADVLAAVGGDHILNPHYGEELTSKTFKEAAVLIPIIDRDGEAFVLLTQRTEHLSSHSGQVAFPGGKIDEGESNEQAALREAHEEVGLNPADVEVLGTFGTYFSGSGYSVAPVVGMVRGIPKLNISEDEVADVFEVPLSFLMNDANHIPETREWKNKEITYYTMPYKDENLDPPVERRIWGLTAGIIHMVQERLYGAANI